MSDETNHEEERVEVEEETCEEVRVGKRISFMDPDGEFTDPGKKIINMLTREKFLNVNVPLRYLLNKEMKI